MLVWAGCSGTSLFSIGAIGSIGVSIGAIGSIGVSGYTVTLSYIADVKEANPSA